MNKLRGIPLKNWKILNAHPEWFAHSTIVYDAEAVFVARDIAQPQTNGAPISEAAAREKPGRYSLHIRKNVGSGFLTVWDVNGEGRELTPREDPRWSGFRPGLDEYVVPGTFEFASEESAAHVVIVWAWSQSEVGRDPASARRRVSEMSAWKRNGVAAIIRESDDATPGEVGTYVVNRAEGGVVAEILFRR